MTNPTAKIYTTVSELKSRKLPRKLVFTNGCFDILHQGHLYYLEASRSMGEFLVVGLNSDSSVRRLKGQSRPVNTWSERALALSQMDFIDLIVKFGEDTPIKLIKFLKPDVVTKGGDYSLNEMIGREYVESYGGEVVIVPYISGFSTTEIIHRTKKD